MDTSTGSAAPSTMGYMSPVIHERPERWLVPRQDAHFVGG
jgi:hypothetical protein